MDTEPNVLILTLYAGENELDDAIAALESQTYSNWEHKIFRYWPNVEGHQMLYQCIMDQRGEFDIFIKLDADMVLESADTLQHIVAEFLEDNTLDHATFTVRDWASNIDIMGLHAYSNKVFWRESPERLFVDPSPEIPGRRKQYWSAPAPVAWHMPAPTDRQAFMFGFHRALKIIQRHRRWPRSDDARVHYELLRSVWARFNEHEDQKRYLVLAGAEYAFRSKENTLERKWGDTHAIISDEAIQDLLDDYRPELVTKRWTNASFKRTWTELRWVKLREWISWTGTSFKKIVRRIQQEWRQ